MSMKGVILAGGTGSRMGYLTKVTNKHLLPAYKKPVIAYPIEVMVNAGIENVFVVTGGEHFSGIAALLGSGANLNESLGIEGRVRFAFGTQDRAGGIAEALGLARDYVGDDPISVILGDNIFQDLNLLRDPVQNYQGCARIFLKEVADDDQLFEIDQKTGKRKAKFGIAELDGDKVVGIEEKPEYPKTRYAVTGLYIYPPSVFDIIPTLSRSDRGELEITDVNNSFIARKEMSYTIVQGWWTDTGTPESLHRATALLREDEHRR